MNIISKLIIFLSFSNHLCLLFNDNELPFLNHLILGFNELILLVILFSGYNGDTSQSRLQTLFQLIIHQQKENEKLKEQITSKKKEDNKENFLILSSYQKILNKCKFPFCREDNKDRQEYCENHLKYKSNECNICYSNEEDCKFSPLSCGHFIHEECYSKMISTNCPICRQENNYLKILKIE